MQAISEDTIRRLNQGDTKAFEQLYNRYYVYLSTVATKYLYSPQTAQEIVNDVFLGVWHRHEELAYPVGSYLVAAVRNRCLNHLRNRRLEEVPLDDVSEQLLAIRQEQIASDPYPLARLETEEVEKQIAAAVDTLPPKCRAIFVQYLYQNKTYEEIAAANHISPSTVRVQIKIGLGKMRELLGEHSLSWLVLLAWWWR